MDPGLIGAFDRSGRPNVSHALETAVLIELERRSNKVAYVRTNAGWEVDFLATSPEGKRTYIQACADLSTAQVRELELRPLKELQSSKAQGDLLLLTLMAGDVSVCQKEAPSGVVVRPAWEWLLEREQ